MTTNNTIVIGTNIDSVKIPKDLTVAVGVSSNVVTVTGELRVPYLSVGVLGEWHLCINNVGNVYRCGSFGNNIAQTSEPNSQKQNEPIEARTKQIKAQQMQINLQDEKLKQQQETIDALKNLVCASNSTAAVCREVK